MRNLINKSTNERFKKQRQKGWFSPCVKHHPKNPIAEAAWKEIRLKRLIKRNKLSNNLADLLRKRKTSKKIASIIQSGSEIACWYYCPDEFLNDVSELTGLTKQILRPDLFKNSNFEDGGETLKS